ncbi:hypothetical protein [Neochlamydia sp. AcF95]|uniref:hypothetical protein n=1 Tax=Neochlamydia sp. AcF95 TaxID=2795734 RepID=UPI001BC9047D|nr:hypothetical protein [Neochlamydia sp. AcF95]MBS4170608.1 Uncharacterized protein [Neochlamydia sp. AcF95]
MKNLFLLLSFFLSIVTFPCLQGDCRGKIDVAPTFVHLDIVNFGNTVKTMDLPAIKIDANALVYKGLCIRPGFMYGSNRGTLLTTGCGLGFTIPTKRWCFTPAVGANYTQLKTKIPLKISDFKLIAKEKFRSWSPYISIEVFYRIAKGCRAGLMVQYAWSRSHTTIKSIGTDKSKSNAKGPSYALLIEKDLHEQWSLNLGFAYNISLTREKHGLRGYGMKAGLAYWF